MTTLITVAAFINAAGMNWFYSKSIQAVGRRDRWMAANWTAGIAACGILTTVIVVQYNILGIAGALLGAWVGTFISVRPVEAVGVPQGASVYTNPVSQSSPQQKTRPAMCRNQCP